MFVTKDEDELYTKYKMTVSAKSATFQMFIKMFKLIITVKNKDVASSDGCAHSFETYPPVSLSLSLLQGHDSNRLWGQKCACVLLGHQLWSASEGLHGTFSQSVPRSLVSTQRGHTVLGLRWWVSADTKCLSRMRWKEFYSLLKPKGN